MTKDSWYENTYDLRTLLRGFDIGKTMGREIEHRFGSLFNPMFGYFHIYDGVDHKVLATIRVDEKNTVRYREDTPFMNEILKFRMQGRDTSFTKSEQLDRHSTWVNLTMQSRIDRAMRERQEASFLAQNEQSQQVSRLSQDQFGRFRMVVPLPTTQTESPSPYTTARIEDSERIVVHMDGQPSDSDMSRIDRMVRVLRRSTGLPSGDYSLGDLRAAFEVLPHNEVNRGYYSNVRLEIDHEVSRTTSAVEEQMLEHMRAFSRRTNMNNYVQEYFNMATGDSVNERL